MSCPHGAGAGASPSECPVIRLNPNISATSVEDYRNGRADGMFSCKALRSDYLFPLEEKYLVFNPLLLSCLSFLTGFLPCNRSQEMWLVSFT